MKKSFLTFLIITSLGVLNLSSASSDGHNPGPYMPGSCEDIHRNAGRSTYLRMIAQGYSESDAWSAANQEFILAVYYCKYGPTATPPPEVAYPSDPPVPNPIPSPK